MRIRELLFAISIRVVLSFFLLSCIVFESSIQLASGSFDESKDCAKESCSAFALGSNFVLTAIAR